VSSSLDRASHPGHPETRAATVFGSFTHRKPQGRSRARILIEGRRCVPSGLRRPRRTPHLSRVHRRPSREHLRQGGAPPRGVATSRQNLSLPTTYRPGAAGGGPLRRTQPRTPPKQDERLTFTFLSGDFTDAAARAKAAAGDQAVQVVGGASVIQQVPRAGLVDEFHIDVMPVLLGAGLGILDFDEAPSVRLEKRAVAETGQRTGLRFRVVT
jgi:riboflavin biosynthesis pyrimidine reductase